MSTVADELLNDFGSSGDEAEEENNGLLATDHDQEDNERDAMDVDGQNGVKEESPEDQNDLPDLQDAEATKARVEKMQLGAVKDVRSVASLMQTLEPVLQVSNLPSKRSTLADGAFTSSLWRHSPNSLVRI